MGSHRGELQRICEDQHKVVVALTNKCKSQESELQRQHTALNTIREVQDVEKSSVRLPTHAAKMLPCQYFSCLNLLCV